MSMIRYLKNDEIDREQWDRCIAKAYNGNIYAWSWYLDIVCDGWEALVQGKYLRVFPLIPGKKFGIPYLYQPPFTQQLGLFNMGLPGGDKTDHFIQEMMKYYRYAEINLNRYNKLEHFEGEILQRRNYELDLVQTYLNIRLLYSENTIRNIRKAEKEKITITSDADPSSIINLFKAHQGVKIKQFKKHHYQVIERLVYACLHRNMAISLGAYDDLNQLIAGAFVFISHQRLVLIFTANNETARSSGAMHLLIDFLIQKYSGTPYILDFEGSEIPGLTRFYSGFGSKETRYPQIHVNKLPFLTKLAVKFVKSLR